MWITILTSVVTSIIVWIVTTLLTEWYRKWRKLRFILKDKRIYDNYVRLKLVIYNPSKITKGFISLKLRFYSEKEIYYESDLESNYGDKLNEIVKSDSLSPGQFNELVVSCDYLPFAKLTKIELVYKDLNNKEESVTLIDEEQGISLSEEKITW